MLNGFKGLREALNMEEADSPASTRKTGVVKKVLNGFGFINVEGQRDDLFFHFSQFTQPVKSGQVQEGMKVSFEVGEGRRGKPAAVNIEILEMPQPPESQKNRSSRGAPPSNAEHYYMPKDTRQAITAQLNYQNRSKPEQQIDNFSLLLNKCAYYDAPKDANKEGKFIFYHKDHYELQPAFPPQLIQAAADRHRAAIKSLNLKMADIGPLQVDWRLIVGLGAESVYETSMTLHHVYGTPYIPGQAVKGVLRSWLILEYFKSEEEALQKQWFCDLFGCPKEKSFYKKAHQGKLTFFDALPTELKPEHIQPDIMNPHYSKYYSEGKPPADWQDPLPVNFLTVQGAAFEFFAGAAPDDNQPIAEANSPFHNKTLLAVVQEQLPLAFSLHGLGAKTAVGYGYFSRKQALKPC